LKEWLLRSCYEKYEKLIIKSGIDTLKEFKQCDLERIKKIGIRLEKD
jgi:hypothetical protein